MSDSKKAKTSALNFDFLELRYDVGHEKEHQKKFTQIFQGTSLFLCQVDKGTGQIMRNYGNLIELEAEPLREASFSEFRMYGESGHTAQTSEPFYLIVWNACERLDCQKPLQEVVPFAEFLDLPLLFYIPKSDMSPEMLKKFTAHHGGLSAASPDFEFFEELKQFLDKKEPIYPVDSSAHLKFPNQIIERVFIVSMH